MNINKKLPSYIRMYEKTGSDKHAPIAGICAGSTCIDRQYVFGDRDGKVFNINVEDGEFQESFNGEHWSEFSLETIMSLLSSQSDVDSSFIFVIDDGMVKAVNQEEV